MSEKARRIILAAVLLDLAIIGVAGYAVGRSDAPLGVLFLTQGGPVPFNHEAHATVGGPGMECIACHHKMRGQGGGNMNCRACHYYSREPHRRESDKVHKRCIGADCVRCHADKECGFCHK
ncbi:MAG: cytochrome c3 family protein [Planctomycetota bacterium]